MAWSARLEAPGLAQLTLTDPANGWHLEALDLGDAMIREVSEDAPDAAGSIDTTSLRGARVVTMLIAATPDVDDVETMERRLRAFTDVSLRPRLFVTRSDGVEKVMTLRAMPFQSPAFAEQMARFVAQWVAPSGILESAEEHTEIIYPGADAASAGLEFDGLEFDGVEFPAVDPPGAGTVVNAGDRRAKPVLRAFGPFGDGTPGDELKIGNVTTGRELVFDGLQVADGDYLEIDVAERTILVNGLAAQSRYDYQVFAESSWWTLAPGSNEIYFRPDTFSGNCQMHVIWRDAWS